MSLADQIESGRLVCPDTKRRLVQAPRSLSTDDGSRVFDVIDGVPVLLPRSHRTRRSGGPGDEVDYHPVDTSGWRFRVDRFFGGMRDHRTAASEEAFDTFIECAGSDRLFLSIGGGPRRRNQALVTLNIAKCDNVDIVGDAHALPYANDSVDGIECEAVLEHLEHPQTAVAEFYRTLRPGGRVYAITPFLQKYHGYPGHFQNFTLQGHEHLFESAGFAIETSGPCVGPAWAITDLGIEFVSQLVPLRGLRGLVILVARCLAIPVRATDRFLNRAPGAVILASTTFVLARKPRAA
jgi:uncharacterized protein YbaR (Trm112 family)